MDRSPVQPLRKSNPQINFTEEILFKMKDPKKCNPLNPLKNEWHKKHQTVIIYFNFMERNPFKNERHKTALILWKKSL